MAIRVLIVDDGIYIRQGLKAALQPERDIEIVGEADTGRRALDLAGALRPDIVLMDVAISAGDGIDAIQAITQRCPETQVLVLTAHPDEVLFVKAVRAGAAGYVLKDISPANLISAIRAVHQGKAIINPGLARQLLEDLAGSDRAEEAARRRPYGLTEREIEVLVEVARGFSDKEIASKLYLSESTVKSHLRAIYRRLRLRNRAQAAAFVMQKNLLPVPSNGGVFGANGAPPSELAPPTAVARPVTARSRRA